MPQLSKSDLPPRKDRQISMISATLPEEVQRLAADMLVDYVYLTVGVVGGSVNLISQVCVCVCGQRRVQGTFAVGLWVGFACCPLYSLCDACIVLLCFHSPNTDHQGSCTGERVVKSRLNQCPSVQCVQPV